MEILFGILFALWAATQVFAVWRMNSAIPTLRRRSKELEEELRAAMADNIERHFGKRGQG